MDPNQDDQNSQNPQTPTGDDNGIQTPVGDAMPGDQAPPAPVGDVPSEGGIGEVAPTPPAMGGEGDAANEPTVPMDAPMGGVGDQPSSDGGSEPTV